MRVNKIKNKNNKYNKYNKYTNIYYKKDNKHSCKYIIDRYYELLCIITK